MVLKQNDIFKFFPLTGQTGFFGTIQENSGRNKWDRDNLKFFGTGQTGFGTIQNFSGRDIRDSGHEKVFPAGLYFVLTSFDDFLQLGPVPFERSDQANFSRPGPNALKIWIQSFSMMLNKIRI